MEEIMFRAIPAFVLDTDANDDQIVYVWCGGELPKPYPTRSGCVKIDFKDKLSLKGTGAQIDDPITDKRIRPLPGEPLLDDEGRPQQGSLYYAEAYPGPTLSQCTGTGSWQIPAALPPAGTNDEIYQYQMLARIDGSVIKRFHGYKAEISPKTSGTDVYVHIYKTRNQLPWWRDVRVDLRDPDLCHPTYTTLSPSAKPGTIGPVFIASNNGLVIPAANPPHLAEPKLPPGYSSGAKW